MQYMISISTKELRNNFQYVIDKILTWEVFLLIHKSKPIAEIKKTKTIKSFSEAKDEDIQLSSINDIWEDYLNKDELEYYLSLK